jgi:hypothetical protein
VLGFIVLDGRSVQTYHLRFFILYPDCAFELLYVW